MRIPVYIDSRISARDRYYRKLQRRVPYFSFLNLPASPEMLDIACGPGMQTIDLVHLAPTATITALDILPHNVAEVRKRVVSESLSDRVSIHQSDMRELEFADCSFDVIWCEGAVYFIGIERALCDWSRVLKPSGFLAFTDNVWIQDSIPEEIRDWWEQRRLKMASFSKYSNQFESLGYKEVGSFVLSPSDWVNDYGPLATGLVRCCPVTSIVTL